MEKIHKIKRTYINFLKRKLMYIGTGLLFSLLTLMPLVAEAQNRLNEDEKHTVTGVIRDVVGESLVGVSVVEKSTTNGTMTDGDGKFSLNVKSDAILVVSYVGYDTQEVAVGNNANLQIDLQESNKLLNEVVVVGYGIQKKVNLTGSVASVSGKKIASIPSANALSSMQGLLPGLTVLRNGGQPGSETSGIRIRGMSSTGTANALVLIDGIESDLALLNPEDIESVSVLKDAAAASIYGARAAAGVVLVTTKTGASAKVKISYNGSVGFNLPTFMPQRLTAWQEQDLINISRINSSIDPITGAATGAAEWDAERSSWVGNPNFSYRTNGQRWDFFQSTNWMDLGRKDYTMSTDHSVSASGGSDKINYYLSAGYHDKNGILKYGPDGNQRTNLRMSLNAELNKYVSANVLGSYQGDFKEQSSYGNLNILNSLYTARGRQPLLNPEEDTNYAINPYNADLQVNPIDIMQHSGANKSRYESFVGKVGLQFKNFVKGLTLDLNASRKADYFNQEIDKRLLAWPGKDGQGQRQSTGASNSLTKTKNYAYQDKLEALLNYNLGLNPHCSLAYKKDKFQGNLAQKRAIFEA
ncbi:MAG: SusC/RagA family TonB-linked outer membrane protein [Dysgonamonadaceae bacterium]|jgi:TonB-linked SusC/RagA family outer membrane protein|nr:SusC/RagA family TonB-linked outer membrane protein [Dysgonamonadaceae bacterium]